MQSLTAVMIVADYNVKNYKLLYAAWLDTLIWADCSTLDWTVLDGKTEGLTLGSINEEVYYSKGLWENARGTYTCSTDLQGWKMLIGTNYVVIMGMGIFQQSVTLKGKLVHGFTSLSTSHTRRSVTWHGANQS